MVQYPLMEPIVDFVFKQIFAGSFKESRKLLIHLLNSVLKLKQDEKITEIIYLNPYNDKEYKEDKISILDIKVKTQDGELIDIEVQINNRDNYRKRSLYYWSRMYGETIEEGEAYETLKKCVVINILDFNLLYETRKYHSIFRVKEVEENYELLKDLEIHYIELPKFDDDRKDIKSMNDLEKWLVFIKDAADRTKREIFEALRKESEVIDMAGRILEELSQDERARQQYYQRKKWLLDEKSKEKYQQIMIERALKRGKEEGIKEGKKEVVKESLDQGLPIEVIAKITKLSEEEIRKIKEEYEKKKN